MNKSLAFWGIHILLIGIFTIAFADYYGMGHDRMYVYYFMALYTFLVLLTSFILNLLFNYTTSQSNRKFYIVNSCICVLVFNCILMNDLKAIFIGGFNSVDSSFILIYIFFIVSIMVAGFLTKKL